MLLAIDTASAYASIAIHDGELLLMEHTWPAGQRPTAELLPCILDMLAAHGLRLGDVTAVAVALGPGSFNGLRAGLSTAKGIALANSCALVGIPTLDLIAHEQMTEQPLLAAGRGNRYQWQPGGRTAELVNAEAPESIRHAGVLAALGWEQLRRGGSQDVASLQPLYVQPPRITPAGHTVAGQAV